MDYIKRIRLQNFKNHVDSTIELDQALTIFIGPNGSGKSTVMDALKLINKVISKCLFKTDLFGAYYIPQTIDHHIYQDDLIQSGHSECIISYDQEVTIRTDRRIYVRLSFKIKYVSGRFFIDHIRVFNLDPEVEIFSLSTEYHSDKNRKDFLLSKLNLRWWIEILEFEQVLIKNKQTLYDHENIPSEIPISELIVAELEDLYQYYDNRAFESNGEFKMPVFSFFSLLYPVDLINVRELFEYYGQEFTGKKNEKTFDDLTLISNPLGMGAKALINEIEKVLLQIKGLVSNDSDVFRLPATRYSRHDMLIKGEIDDDVFDSLILATSDRNKLLISKWIKEFAIGEQLGLIRYEKRIINFDFSENADSTKQYRHLSTGQRQLLPIIINAWQHRRITLIEEPEANLHPMFQSKLADLFIDKILEYLKDLEQAVLIGDDEFFALSKFIVETHSEYLIRKLQFLIAANHPDLTSQVKIYYFGANGPYEIKIDKYGVLSREFESGFFDEADNISIELFNLLKSRDN